MKKQKDMPSQVFINEAFTYHDGKLYWNVRPQHHFNTVRGCNRTNSEFAGRMAGDIHHTGYVYIRFMGFDFAAHRLIWVMHHGPIPDSMEIDHIDKDRLNNRIENLRLSQYSGQASNQRKRKDNKSGFRGVCFEKETGRYVASIQANRKQIKIGRFRDAESAALAYDRYARVLHGEFASLNFPKKKEQKC